MEGNHSPLDRIPRSGGGEASICSARRTLRQRYRAVLELQRGLEYIESNGRGEANLAEAGGIRGWAAWFTIDSLTPKTIGGPHVQRDNAEAC